MIATEYVFFDDPVAVRVILRLGYTSEFSKENPLFRVAIIECKDLNFEVSYQYPDVERVLSYAENLTKTLSKLAKQKQDIESKLYELKNPDARKKIELCRSDKQLELYVL
jgi:O-glycosyl hydrolase